MGLTNQEMERNYYMINSQKLLFVVLELHKRGYEKLHIVPALAPSGMAWRCTFVSEIYKSVRATEWFEEFARAEREINYTIEELTDRFERDHSDFLESCRGRNTDYLLWFRGMLNQLEKGELPYALAEYFYETEFWGTTKQKKIRTLPDENRFYSYL